MIWWGTLWLARRASSCLCLAILCSGAVAAETPSPKGHGVDPSDEFFTNGPIPHLRIELKGTNLTELRRDNRAYVRAVVREGEVVYSDVGIHLKGAAGSFRSLEDRPALTLHFDKFQGGQRFHGLDKIHLNNSVQDSSYMTEILCGELFRAAGVPTARGTHARVFLNNRDLGLYVLKEGFDKTFLRRYFKNPNGNLYDGGFLREITDPLQKNSGEEEAKPYAELRRLAAAAREPDPVLRLQRLDKLLNVDQFISFIAMEVITWHWDGYAMKKNNYRIYHDPDTDKVSFFPHGMDQMFWVPDGSILPPFEGLVAQQLVAAPEGRRLYRERVSSLFTNVFKLAALTNRLSQLQSRIRPELVAISEDVARKHDGAVRHLRNEIVQRAKYLEKLLSLPEPKPLQFDEAGYARLLTWRPHDMPGTSFLDRSDETLKSLHIGVGEDGQCKASWRTRVLLPTGTYVFEGRVRTRQVMPLADAPKQTPKGEGAGIRISGTRQSRPNQVSGDSDWQRVEFPFQVTKPSDEIELVCELRASKGEAWFDLDSLRLKRGE